LSSIYYNLLAKGIKANDEHSAIVESYSSNFDVEIEAFVYMVNTPEVVVRKFEEKSLVQQVQHDMLQA